MDESVAIDGDRGGASGRNGDDGRYLVLLHSCVRAGGLHADSAGGFSSFRSRRAIGNRLPVLSQCGGAVVVFKCAGGRHVHELPQPGAEGRSAAGAGARERGDRQTNSLGANT